MHTFVCFLLWACFFHLEVIINNVWEIKAEEKLKKSFHLKANICRVYCTRRKRLCEQQYFCVLLALAVRVTALTVCRLHVHLQCSILLLCAHTVSVHSSLPRMQFISALDAAVFYCGADHVAVNEQDCMNNVLFIQRLDKNECPQHLHSSNLHHFLCAYSSWSFNYLSLETIWQLQVVTTQQVNPRNTRSDLHIK